MTPTALSLQIDHFVRSQTDDNQVLLHALLRTTACHLMLSKRPGISSREFKVVALGALAEYLDQIEKQQAAARN